ncbi:ABC transporter permease [Brochothrix thermosphacta]|uniref:ABC transporter n=1 Tax=Brochothrix thermosphacta TaxID=2756 RepID=A0A1D2LQ80_BROTH|nr:ABC transporter permease [Brochothrix thermosphacta]ATF27076.1 ABC transporter [Brochothrix thermosphacta]ATH86435.1 ABC transporter [Brochothrix thermosphacta]MPQ28011.1 ABC transporter permease [Brochothrix thermosphacta]ODJ63212.1 ABC transporter [Brochothrix thermosphacta]ODJ72099.1 ABC transporter [Brochothrix thermosphacta]
METMKNRNKSTLVELSALIKWSLLRHKSLLPVFTATQAFLSVAIVYGLALLIPDVDNTTAIYLSSGATTLGIIAVGCVLAAQIVSSAKQDGIVDYQRTLPVSRLSILIADFVIWGMASLPGVLMSFLASYVKFKVEIFPSISAILALIVIQICMISIGFSIAYWLAPNVVGLVTQIIMIGGLLFSPITYPTDRLPATFVAIFEFLPFVPASNVIRSLFFGYGSFDFKNIMVLLAWTIVTCILSLKALSRRD